MSYQNANKRLPAHLLEEIQKYIDGEAVYIPRRPDRKRNWGENSSTRRDLEQRNMKIRCDASSGLKVADLAKKYFLSEKSVQRIILQGKQK